jgi:hypothetical protein
MLVVMVSVHLVNGELMSEQQHSVFWVYCQQQQLTYLENLVCLTRLADQMLPSDVDFY